MKTLRFTITSPATNITLTIEETAISENFCICGSISIPPSIGP